MNTKVISLFTLACVCGLAIAQVNPVYAEEFKPVFNPPPNPDSLNDTDPPPDQTILQEQGKMSGPGQTQSRGNYPNPQAKSSPDQTTDFYNPDPESDTQIPQPQVPIP